MDARCEWMMAQLRVAAMRLIGLGWGAELGAVNVLAHH